MKNLNLNNKDNNNNNEIINNFNLLKRKLFIKIFNLNKKFKNVKNVINMLNKLNELKLSFDSMIEFKQYVSKSLITSFIVY